MKIKTFLLITMFVATDSLLSAQGLIVEPGTCIKVESGTTLNISGGGDLFLGSNANGDASLIEVGNGTVSYTGGGKAKVQRYLTQGKWHLISAPVSNAVSGMFTNDYLQTHDETSNGWTDITSTNASLTPGKGYALWTVAGSPTTVTFTGTTNTGSQSYSFSKNGDGYNLVGNPYPSVLDWDAVTIPGELNGAIWLYDPTDDVYKYYIHGGGASNTTTQYIPSGQGFFVKATTGAGTLSFSNSDRTHGGQTFFKAATQSNQMLVLKATGNNITTQTAIRFIPEATQHVDRLYDVNKIITNSTDVPNVYTKCDDEKMAINTLPSIAGNETVPMYFEAGMDGTYSFTATELKSIPEDVPVFLEDVSAKYIQDLRKNPKYSFDYTTGAVKQFNIHFQKITGVDKYTTQAPAFQSFLSNGRLSVNYLGSNPFEGEATINVYSLTGQRVLTKKSDHPQTEILFSHPAGIYIVHIQYKQAIYSTKVFNR